MYLRQARRKVPIQVFQCVIEIVGNPEPKVYYFVSNILMGASLESQTFKVDEKKEKKGPPDLLETYL